MAAVEAPQANDGMAWIVAQRDVIRERIVKVRATLPLLADVGVAAAGGAVQGGCLGGLMGAVTKPPDASTVARMAQTNPQAAQQMAAMQQMNQGGPLTYARNFAVMTGVHAGASHLLLKVRGKEDLPGSMAASFCSGFAFALVSGVGAGGASGRLGSAVTTGMFVSAFQGVFYKIGNAMSKRKGEAKDKDEDYAKAKRMLTGLGLERYEKNFKRCQLSDKTLKLLNDSALQEAKIPPGPRLLILDRITSNQGL